MHSKNRLLASLLALLSLSAGSLLTTAEAADLWDAGEELQGWTRRHKLQFNNNNRGQLDGFTVMIELTESDFDLSVLDVVDGTDIRFVDDQNTPTDASDDVLLDYEVSWQHNANGDSDPLNDTITARFFVFVPTIDGNSTSDYIQLYYGKPSPADPGPMNPWNGRNRTGTQVWDGYSAVFHMEPSSGEELNATGSGKLVSNSASPPTTATGLSGAGLSYNGSSTFSTYLSPTDVEELYALTASTNHTLLYWAKPNNTATNTGVLGYTSSSSSNEDETYGQFSSNEVQWAQNEEVLSVAKSEISTTSWNLLAFTRSHNSNDSNWDLTSYLYSSATPTTASHPDAGARTANTALKHIGRIDHYNGGSLSNSSYFDGTLDELRIANVALSADWIDAEYANLTGSLINMNCSTTRALYADADGDGFGDLYTPVTVCDGVEYLGYIDNSTDCDDTDAARNPGQPEICDPANKDEDCDGNADDDDDEGAAPTGTTTYYADNDNDTYGTTITADFCDDPGSNYASVSGDCDDNDPTISPAAVEICDPGSVDEDCNGLADDKDPNVSDASRQSWYIDSDKDGFGSSLDSGLRRCDNPSGGGTTYLLSNTDCDDSDKKFNPGVDEIAGDEIDQNCDSAELCFIDADNDGYIQTGRPTVHSPNLSCADLGEAGKNEPDDDCADDNPDINPGAAEICDQIDNNCNGKVDLNDPSLDQSLISMWYPDSDGDSYGDQSNSGTQACESQSGHVTNNADCNDTDPAISPDATEVCDADNIDENCNGLANDADATVDHLGTGTDYFPDNDKDGQGDPSGLVRQCAPPAGYLTDSRDCNDNDNDIYTDRPNDCNTSTTQTTYTCDCNGIDNDCDGRGGPDWDVDGDGATWAEEAAVGAGDCNNDSDGDSVSDTLEWNNGLDTDNDGKPNIMDPDDDGDGVLTIDEDVNENRNAHDDNTDAFFTVSDSIPDYLDDDDDNDGILTIHERQDGANGYFLLDTDNDDIPNFRDNDDDGDTIETRIERLYGINHLNNDHDADSVHDGIEWGSDRFGPPRDSDGDGVADPEDTDDDNDGILTVVEGSDDIDGKITRLDANGVLEAIPTDDPDYCIPAPDGIPNYLDNDSDGDGIDDAIEGETHDTDRDGIKDYRDCNDADGLWGDSDRDGLLNGTEYLLNGDEEAQDLVDLINNSTQDLPPLTNACPDPSLMDSDGDGISDDVEVGVVNDHNNAAQNIETTGVNPFITLPDYDQDGVPDICDDDDDGDGILTRTELDADRNGLLSQAELLHPVDTDSDGIPDFLDLDDDDDGVPTSEEIGNINNIRDTDNDGTPDYLDEDDDGDGILTLLELLTTVEQCGTLYGEGQNSFSTDASDCDGDSVPNHRDARDTNGPDWDNDRDHIPNDLECSTCFDLNGDGEINGLLRLKENDGLNQTGGIDAPCSTPAFDPDAPTECANNRSLDSDNDSIPDLDEWGGMPGIDMPVDSDGDGIPDLLDEDDDNDGLLTVDEDHTDIDGDGLPGYLDSDSDGDGIPDGEEGWGDSDGDGIPDVLDADDTPRENRDTSWMPDEISSEPPRLCGGSGAGMLPLLLLGVLLRRREQNVA